MGLGGFLDPFFLPCFGVFGRQEEQGGLPSLQQQFGDRLETNTPTPLSAPLEAFRVFPFFNFFVLTLSTTTEGFI